MTPKSLTTMQYAFARANFKVRREKRRSWPRVKGPRARRVDCSTGHAVAFIR